MKVIYYSSRYKRLIEIVGTKEKSYSLSLESIEFCELLYCYISIIQQIKIKTLMK